VKRLYFISDIKKSGQSCKKYSGEKFYVATGDIENNKITSGEYFTYYNKPSRANVCCKKADVLFAKMQNTIKVLEIDDTNVNFIYSTGFYSFYDERIDSRFLKYFFKSQYFNILKDKNCQGATMKAINDDGISEISIPLYDKQKQEKIIDELDKLSNLINYNQIEIKNYEELIKSRFMCQEVAVWKRVLKVFVS